MSTPAHACGNVVSLVDLRVFPKTTSPAHPYTATCSQFSISGRAVAGHRAANRPKPQTGTSKWNRIEHRLFCHITMNWRGRPLASHEVLVQTIAATTTATGLAVHAELDTGQYATGVTISDAQMADLPITRHDWHGDWNYTLLPRRPAAIAEDTAEDTTDNAAAAALSPGDRAWLRHPTLTGLPPREWNELISRLTLPRHTQREADLHRQRGGPRRVAPGTGRHPALTLTDRVLITVLHQRFSLPQAVLAELFQVTHMTANRAIRQIRPLLDQIGHTITPTEKHLYSMADLTAYAARTGIISPPQAKSAC